MLAIVGGTGLYKLEGFELVEEVNEATPFGNASTAIQHGHIAGREILFMPRHGSGHSLLPHEINYRANIFALKQAGATMLLGFSACGSLRQELEPGDFVLPSQYFDWIKGNREKTFFGKGLVAHVSTAEPVCPSLSKWIKAGAKALDITLHSDKTYACVDGPRLGTRAESHFLRSAGCDILGMTNVPEVFLAREAQMSYACIGIVTDYDCWQEDPSTHVSVQQVISRYGSSIAKAKSLLTSLLKGEEPKPSQISRNSLGQALMCSPDKLHPEQRHILDILQR